MQSIRRHRTAHPAPRNRTPGVLLATLASVCVLSILAPAALAAPPSITISGSGTDGFSPDSSHNYAEVAATLTGGVPSGTLSTTGKVGDFDGIFYEFTGSVTCISIKGTKAVIGAFGHVSVEEGPHNKRRPGTYAQILTVQFGHFLEEAFEEPTYASDTYGMLGEHNEGVASASAPDCGGSHSFAHQFLPTFGGVISESPSITKPTDGRSSHHGIVKLAGTAEPNTALKVYEVGEEADGIEVTANSAGKWKATFEEVLVGTRFFSATAVDGSAIPANVVEVRVVS